MHELLAGVLTLQGYIAGIQGDGSVGQRPEPEVMSIPGVERFPFFTSALSIQALDLYCQNRFTEAEQCLLASIHQAKANNALFLLKSLNLLCAGYYYLGKHHLSEGVIAEAEAWMSPEMQGRHTYRCC